MYPDWPESDADLVPLPNCDGPKLKPFNFHGPQKIEFLEYLGKGLHAHVFKIKILGRIYALKLVGRTLLRKIETTEFRIDFSAYSLDFPTIIIGWAPQATLTLMIVN